MLQQVLPVGGRVASVITRATFPAGIDAFRPRPGRSSRPALLSRHRSKRVFNTMCLNPSFAALSDHIRRNTTLRLFAGISVIIGTENPTDCAIAATASRSRRPQVGLRSRRLLSNAWLLGAVANPMRLY